MELSPSAQYALQVAKRQLAARVRLKPNPVVVRACYTCLSRTAELVGKPGLCALCDYVWRPYS